MTIQMATSSSCPFSIESLKEMSFNELFDWRDKINYLDALEVATKLDYKKFSERPKSR